MTKQLVNLGTADKGNGDPLRVAFEKINGNFNELYQTTSSVTVDISPPNTTNIGSLWWDETSGKLYVYIGGAWVDASPISGAGAGYTPSTPIHWTSPVTTIADALDQLAARIYAIENL